MADRPRLTDEDMHRMVSALAPKDGRLLRAYVAAHEQRLGTQIQDVMLSIGGHLADIRRSADDAHAMGKINGTRIDRLAEVTDALPGRLSAILDAHEAHALEVLRPVHEAAQRSMQAEAARVELELEAQRVEIDGRRRKLEHDHAGTMEVRSLIIELFRRAPWWVVGTGAAMLAGGASLKEVVLIVVQSLTGGTGMAP